MSTVGSPRPFAHRHFGFDNPHALGAGRLSPLSHDSLVAMSCSLINFSSRASSRWVHMDVTFESHLPLSVSLPDLPCAPSAFPPEAGNRHPVPRVSFRYSNSMLDTIRFSHKVKHPAKIPRYLNTVLSPLSQIREWYQDRGHSKQPARCICVVYLFLQGDSWYP